MCVLCCFESCEAGITIQCDFTAALSEQRMLCHSESRIDRLTGGRRHFESRGYIQLFLCSDDVFFHQKWFGGKACGCGKCISGVIFLLSVLDADKGVFLSPWVQPHHSYWGQCPAAAFRSCGTGQVGGGGRLGGVRRLLTSVSLQPDCGRAWPPRHPGALSSLLGLKHGPSVRGEKNFKSVLGSPLSSLGPKVKVLTRASGAKMSPLFLWQAIPCSAAVVRPWPSLGLLPQNCASSKMCVCVGGKSVCISILFL